MEFEIEESRRKDIWSSVLRASLIIIIYAFNDPQILHLGHLIRAAVAPPPPFTFTVKEKLNVALNQFGGISSFNLVGTLSLQTLTQDDDGFLLVQIHPRFNKSLFENKKILALMTPVPAFPTTGLGGDGVLVR
ncbi:unnamed protein product [Brassica oleracea]